MHLGQLLFTLVGLRSVVCMYLVKKVASEQKVAFEHKYRDATTEAVLPCTIRNVITLEPAESLEWSRKYIYYYTAVTLTRNSVSVLDKTKYRPLTTMTSVGTIQYSLQITNVSKSDEGIYECSLTNKDGSRISASKILEVSPLLYCPDRFYLEHAGWQYVRCSAHFIDPGVLDRGRFIWTFTRWDKVKKEAVQTTMVAGESSDWKIGRSAIRIFGYENKPEPVTWMYLEEDAINENPRNTLQYPIYTVRFIAEDGTEIVSANTSLTQLTCQLLEALGPFSTKQKLEQIVGRIYCRVLFYLPGANTVLRWSFVEGLDRTAVSADVKRGAFVNSNGRLIYGSQELDFTFVIVEDVIKRRSDPLHTLTLLESGKVVTNITVSLLAMPGALLHYTAETLLSKAASLDTVDVWYVQLSFTLAFALCC